MPRPTVLIAEPEPEQALSTRKLVVETGKFNVLTAHSGQEALDVFRLFPNISAAVLVVCEAIDAAEVANQMKSIKPALPIICLSPRIDEGCAHADYTISSYEPHALLERLRSLLGDPRGDPRELK